MAAPWAAKILPPPKKKKPKKNNNKKQKQNNNKTQTKQKTGVVPVLIQEPRAVCEWKSSHVFNVFKQI